MPCTSRIMTKIDNVERLKKAIKAVGLKVTYANECTICTSSGLSFSRRTIADAFSAAGNGLEAVARKYAEIGAREWGKSKGYSVTASTDRTITLIKR